MKINTDKLKKIVQQIALLFKKAASIGQKLIKRFVLFLKKSWRSVIVFVPLFLVVYYIGGAFLSHKIDTDIHFTSDAKKGYAVVQTAADLIERETDKNLYTPNLPFVFPAYILDDMPAFQNGIFISIQGVVDVLAEGNVEPNITKAKELLSYPPNVWLFSKTKDFKIALSSVAQYRKARRKSLEFNEHAEVSEIVLERITSKLSADLWNISEFLESQIKATAVWKADDVFYEALGRLYADYLFLRVTANQNMPQTGLALKALETALGLKPFFIRNGLLGHTVSTNHLLQLSYFALKAHTFLLDAYMSSIR